MARSKSSANWLNEHVHDVYVHQAKADGYRARAAYKLIEINEKDRLIHPNTVLVDLGSAPGSWCQVASGLIGAEGKIFALDILEMPPVPHVTFIQGDFREETVLNTLIKALHGRPLDLVLSDMAPNMTGERHTDQARSYYLCELALEFAKERLKVGGDFVVKVFQGSDFQPYLKAMKAEFETVISRKPKASRDRSTEIYLIGKNKLP